ncbi:MAG: DegT/DnrJ/EryC1/StrS family aminotransferase [Granulosicoccus sp.]
MLNTPFSPWPSFSETEIEAASKVLRSNKVNYWTGNEGKEFEREFAAWTQASHGIALANGTLALDLAWHALDLQPGDEVIVTSRTYLASASSIVLAGAIPVFADVDLDSQNITAKTIEPLITPRTRAICCVHLAGWPCEMDEINDLASSKGLAVVEDCAQAHGARYRGVPVGGFGQIGAWSFCQDKIMTTAGEGGMVTTNDESLWDRMWSYKDHGKSYKAVHAKDHPPGFRWLHESFGTNWRLTEIQSTIGRYQLTQMHNWTACRRANAKQILDCADQMPALRVPRPAEHILHAQYKCYVFVQPDLLKSGWSRDRIMAEINAQGVPCFSGSCSEVYLEKAFDNKGLRPEKRLPNARRLADESLMFLVHPTLTQQEIGKTCDVLASVVRQASCSIEPAQAVEQSSSLQSRAM